MFSCFYIDLSNENMPAESPTSTTNSATTPTTDATNSNTNVTISDADDNGRIHDDSGINLSDSIRQCYAFTIDNDEQSKLDAQAKAAKYKQMLERINNRHKRGASMSKLDNDISTGNTSMKKSTTQQLNTNNSEFMPRTRSTQRSSGDFASKRRSWSPRTFEHKAKQMDMSVQQQQQQQQHLQTKKNKKVVITTGNRTDDDQCKEHNKYFKPRSMVMQMAMKKTDYVCTQPLLDDHDDDDDDDDNFGNNDKISEAGTYTLEGDAYTEEQKDSMNIDKNLQCMQHKIVDLSLQNELVTEDLCSDMGCITSVTTSGVLSKLSLRPASSLISTSPRYNGTQPSIDAISACSSTTAAANTSDAAILKTAQTRKDWVKEWARNARARSLANDYVSSDVDYDQNMPTSPTSPYARGAKQRQIMSQSLTNAEHFTTQQSNAIAYKEADIRSDTSSISLRSPHSYTKIPSPLHTNRRARSSSRINAVASMLLAGENINEQNNGSLSARSANPSLQRSTLICTQLQPQNVMMTASYNEHQMPTVNAPYRGRKNSCDGKLEYNRQQRMSPLHRATKAPRNATPKSASSNNFRKMYDYDYEQEMEQDEHDDMEYYVEDLDEGLLSSPDYAEDETEQETVSEDPVLMSHYKHQQAHLRELRTPPHTAAITLANSRYNKTLLMRIQVSQERAAAEKQQDKVNGTAACPNTPELPRRNLANKMTNSRGRNIVMSRMSEPRDNSVRRRESPQVPKSLDMAKKQLMQTSKERAQSAGTANSARVQPKYLDISKYQAPQSRQFLRKNESRITLKVNATPVLAANNIPPNNMKRSPSASGLSRNDSTRNSKGSIRAMPTCMTSSGTTLSGNAHGLGLHANNSATRSPASRFEPTITKQRVVELELWKRRNSYDPLRAAAEDRRRKEELKRQARM